MSSTFFGLNTAYTGLLAANAALNTTANNIANVETQGYSRQYVNQVAANALRTFNTYGCAGAGVEALSIERIHDNYYDEKYWSNNCKYGEYDVKKYYMAQMEDYFMDSDELAGFTTIFNDMYKALSEVQKNAGDTSTRSQFIGQAGNLAEYFNSMYVKMQNMQKDVNAEIKVKTDEINSYAEKLASLNNQINVIEVNGGNANELRDERIKLIDKLSKVVDVEVSETPITDVNDPSRKTGANRFLVKIGGGKALVDGASYNSLTCVARESYEKINQSDAEGLFDIFWQDENGNVNPKTAEKLNIYGANLAGELKGLVQLRDGNNGEYFNGKVASIGTTTDGTGRSTVSVAVTDEYLTDINKMSLTDSGGIINLGNQLFGFDSWTLEHDTVADTYAYNFILSDTNTSILSGSRVGKTATVGSRIDYQGIPYYMSQMNEWVRTYATSFNGIITNGGVDKYEEAATNFFAAVDLVTGDEHLFAVDTTNGFEVSSDSYFKLTAGTFSIAKKMQEDSNRFPTHTGAAEGQDKYDLIEKLVKMKDDTSVTSFRGASVSEFLQGILSDVSLNASNANLFQTNYSNLESQIEIQRKSISGVDNDEEAVNLVKFQNSYNLAAKMIQVLSEVYDRLILNTGV